MSKERMTLTGLAAYFENGQHLNLDTSKIQIIDRVSGKPLFEEVLEPVPQLIEGNGDAVTPSQEFADDPNAYVVEFDTPEGKMEYVKNGNFSGVRLKV